MTRRNVEYWACQIGGWGDYTAFFLAIAVVNLGWHPAMVTGKVLFFFYSIGLTHLLRREIRRRAWTSLPLLKVLGRLAVASVAIAVIQSGIYVAINAALEGNRGIVAAPDGIAYMFLGFSVFAAVWSVLYFSITAVRHSREVRRKEAQMKLALSEAELSALEGQTLVENAIKHGVEDLPSGADVWVRAFRDGEALRVVVENTGALSEGRAASTQVGLANARERLRILCGERASLDLAASKEGRVAVTLLSSTPS